MKFCPQCGTFFDPDARFCSECGFDRLSAESSLPLAVEILIPETETNVAEMVEATKSEFEIIPVCPNCGSELIPGNRFCLKCGFDTLADKEVVEVIPIEIQQHSIEEVTIEVSPFTGKVTTPGNKQFCPQCGSGIDDNEQFCQECGFDTKSNENEIVSDTKPEPTIIPPLAQKQPNAKPIISQPAPEPAQLASPNYNQNSQNGEAAAQQKEKKTWPLIAMILIGACILGAAGWFGYNKYLSPTKRTPAHIVASPQPMSLMDQELAKQRAKVQNQGTQKNTTDEGAVESAITEENKIPSKIILEVGKTEEPKNKNPKNPAKLTISKPTMITRITTDHYNDGMGTPRGGIITIKDRSGMVVAGYKALGKTGKNGTPSAKWVVEPDKILTKGTYFIWDSDPLTWSKTFIGNNGFVIVEGYEVK